MSAINSPYAVFAENSAMEYVVQPQYTGIFWHCSQATTPWC